MGSGPARELSSSGPARELDPSLSQKMGVALAKMDELDSTFKQSRDDERFSQLSKMWNNKVMEIDSILRELCASIIRDHQLALESGVEGGGIGAKPWVEDPSHMFPKLWFELVDAKVQASSDGKVLASVAPAEMTSEWCERLIVAWVVTSVKAKL